MTATGDILKDAKCMRCQKMFEKKDIYTIQQFQYRKTPSYQWTKDFFENQKIGEWDSFCEECILYLKRVSEEEFDASGTL